MFTNDEIDLINDALDALTSKAGMDHFTFSMLGVMLSPDKESREETIEKENTEYEAKEQERKMLEERITLLRAKLIQVRDKAIAEEFASSI